MRVAALLGAGAFACMVASSNAAIIYAVDNLGEPNHNTAGDRVIRFNSANPLGTMTILGPTGITGQGMSGLEFDDSGTLYAMSGFATTAASFAGSKLYTINTTSGAATLVGSSGLTTNEAITDLSWNPVTRRMQALSYGSTDAGTFNRLYTVNLVSGAVTLLGTLTGVDGSVDVGLATDSAGVNYIHNVANDRMYKLSGVGAATMTATLGFDTNFSQGMVIDWRSGDEWYLGANGPLASSNGLFQLSRATGGVLAQLATWPTNGGTGLPEFETGDLAIAPEPSSVVCVLGVAGLQLVRRRHGTRSERSQ